MPSRKAIIAAFAVAIAADLLQIPLSMASFTGVLAVPAEGLDLGVDFLVLLAIGWLLGFQVPLVPAMLLESIPILDMFPAWTAVVAYMVWKSYREVGRVPPPAERRMREVRDLSPRSGTEKPGVPPVLKSGD